MLLCIQPAPVQRGTPDCSSLPARAVWCSLPTLDLLPALFLLGEPPNFCLPVCVGKCYLSLLLGLKVLHTAHEKGSLLESSLIQLYFPCGVGSCMMA